MSTVFCSTGRVSFAMFAGGSLGTHLSTLFLPFLCLQYIFSNVQVQPCSEPHAAVPQLISAENASLAFVSLPRQQICASCLSCCAAFALQRGTPCCSSGMLCRTRFFFTFLVTNHELASCLPRWTAPRSIGSPNMVVL